jgi:putative DNA primase/helicase
MVSNNHIIRIYNQLHIYVDGVYVPGKNIIEAEMIRYIPGLSASKRKEVLAYLDLLVKKNTRPSDARYIAFRNCVYDIEANESHPFDPSFVITNKINWNWNPAAYSELCDRVLDDLACNDKATRQLLEEVAGYVLYRRNELRKAFIFTGQAAAGKSTFLDMIETMLGDQNTVALDLKELGDRFKTAEIFGKLAIIGDDIGDEFIPNPAIFRKLTSGDRVNVERKGMDPFDFNSYAKPLFSANDIPRIKDKSGAVKSRLVIVPFKAEFSSDSPNFDPYIKYKLKDDDVMEYLIRIGIEGLKNVLKNRKFTISAEMQKQMDEYEENNNPLLLFLKDEEPEVENQTTSSIYKAYKAFCIANGFQSISNVEFTKQINRRFKMNSVVKKIDGKTVRVFVRK